MGPRSRGPNVHEGHLVRRAPLRATWCVRRGILATSPAPRAMHALRLISVSRAALGPTQTHRSAVRGSRSWLMCLWLRIACARHVHQDTSQVYRTRCRAPPARRERFSQALAKFSAWTVRQERFKMIPELPHVFRVLPDASQTLQVPHTAMVATRPSARQALA